MAQQSLGCHQTLEFERVFFGALWIWRGLFFFRLIIQFEWSVFLIGSSAVVLEELNKICKTDNRRSVVGHSDFFQMIVYLQEDKEYSIKNSDGIHLSFQF